MREFNKKAIILFTTLLTLAATANMPRNAANQERMLGMFTTTPNGHRFPKWLQITTFVLLLLIIIISLVLIGVWSRSNAGPARLNQMVIQTLRMQGKLPKLNRGAMPMGGMPMGYPQAAKAYGGYPLARDPTLDVSAAYALNRSVSMMR